MEAKAEAWVEPVRAEEREAAPEEESKEAAKAAE